MAILVVGHLHAKDRAARQTIVDELKQVLAYSETQEPGVTKYALCLGRDPADELSVFAIEEYADQAVFDAHMGSSAVQGLIKVFTEQDLFSAATDVYVNHSVYSMAKPRLNQVSDPYIIFAQILFKPGTKAQGLDGLREVITGARNLEASTLAYNVLEDKENPSLLRIVSAYESESAYNQEHLKAAVVAENERRNRPNWEKLSVHTLKLAAGYLHKGRLPDHSGL